MNKVVLMGRPTRDPEIRTTPQGMSVARYTLAVDRPRRRTENRQDEEEPGADFITCVAFDKAAAFAEKYLKQGTKIIISGRIQTGSYTNKEGRKVYTTDIVIESQEFCESRAAGGSTRPAPIEKDENGFLKIPDDALEDEGLPFT